MWNSWMKFCELIIWRKLIVKHCAKWNNPARNKDYYRLNLTIQRWNKKGYSSLLTDTLLLKSNINKNCSSHIELLSDRAQFNMTESGLAFLLLFTILHVSLSTANNCSDQMPDLNSIHNDTSIVRIILANKFLYWMTGPEKWVEDIHSKMNKGCRDTGSNSG